MLDTLTNLSMPFVALALLGFFAYTFSRGRKLFVFATIMSLIAFFCLTVVLLGAMVAADGVFGDGIRYLVASWVIMVIYFIAEFKYKIRLLGSILMPAALVLMLVYIFSGSETPRALPYDQLFTTVHVFMIFAAFGLTFLASAGSALFLVKTRALKRHKATALDGQLPALSTLQRLMETAFNSGFPMLTIGLTLAMVYAASVLNSGWFWDPKIIYTLGIWLFYSVLFFMHHSGKLSHQVLARCILVLFICVLASFLLMGRHSLPEGSSAEMLVNPNGEVTVIER